MNPSQAVGHRYHPWLSAGKLHRSRFAVVVLVLAATLCGPFPARGQTPSGVSADLAPTTPPVRMGEPMPTLWDVQKLQPGLVEGSFEFRVHLGSLEFYRYTTDELVLHEPSHRFSFLFPPVITNLRSPELEIDVLWKPTKGEPIPSRMQVLRVPFSAQRSLLIGVVEPRSFRARRPDWQQRLDGLKLETLGAAPVDDNSRYSGRLPPLQTVMVTWTPADISSHPLSLLPYEIIAVSEGVLPQLRGPQLEALERYCRAGQSLYLEVGGQLESVHLDFLSRLTLQSPAPLTWLTDDEGVVIWPGLVSSWKVPCDLGRVVVVDSGAISQLNADMSGLSHYLWNWPEGRNPNIDPNAGLVDMYGNWNNLGDIRGERRRLQGELEAALMPPSVQLVPFQLVIGLLIGLLLLIGPLDWWGLGRLRLRRFTWLSWPGWTLLCTLLTVGLSNWYMQSNDVPQSLTIHDLGSDGRVLRTHEFRLEFPSTSRTATQSITSGMWQPLPSGSAVPQSNWRTPTGTNARFTVNMEESTVTHPPSYSGRIPNLYSVTQEVVQWTPQLSYRLNIPATAEAEPVPIDWTKIDALDRNTTQDFSRELLGELQRQHPGKVSIRELSRSTNGHTQTRALGGAYPRTNAIVDSLTSPPDFPGAMANSSTWSDTFYRGVFLPPLAGPGSTVVWLVAVEHDNGATWYRRLVPAHPHSSQP